MSGLVVYLAGPGRQNEHESPHLVAGDPALLAWHDDAELDRDAALQIARHLDLPRKAFGVDVPGGHVWHCSLSAAVEDGKLRDDQWQEICERFVREMGFDDQGGTRAPCRWVAIHHGPNANGNDHVHIALNLVREDGTKANIHNDRPRSQKVCRAIERDYGLRSLEAEGRGRTTVGYKPGEREAEARRRARAAFERDRRSGLERREWKQVSRAERDRLVAASMRADQPRFELARAVRGAATASRDEAEFVRRMRRDGLLVRPRFASGRDDVVTGYSVAHRPEPGVRPIWYGGGHLAHDLNLSRLRERWEDTPQSAELAAAEWRAAKRGRRPVAPGAERRELSAAEQQRMAQDLANVREQLRSVPVDDRATWAAVAQDTAGVLSAWSRKVEPTPGPLARAADSIARSGQYRQSPEPVQPRRPGAMAGVMIAAAAAQGGNSTTAQLALVRSVANLSRALYDMHQAQDEAAHAHRIEQAVRRDLAAVGARLESAQQVEQLSASEPEALRAAERARAGMSNPGNALGSPIPNRLEPRRQQATITQERTAQHERE